MSYPLSDQKLEDCLDVLLKHMQKNNLLPNGCDLDKIKATLMQSLTKAFESEEGVSRIPPEIFRNHKDLTKLIALVAHAAHQQLHPDPDLKIGRDTLTLTRAFFDKRMDPAERIAALKNCIDDIKKLAKPAAKKASVSNDLSDIQLFQLQMLGIAAEGLPIVIQYLSGNSVGATDSATKTGSGSAGWMFAQDSPDAQSLSPEAKAMIKAGLERVADSLTSILDAVTDEMQGHLRSLQSPRPSMGPIGSGEAH